MARLLLAWGARLAGGRGATGTGVVVWATQTLQRRELMNSVVACKYERLNGFPSRLPSMSPGSGEPIQQSARTHPSDPVEPDNIIDECD